MSERLSNLGYFAFAPETNPGVAATPNYYVPIFSESIETKGNFVPQTPIYGNKFEVFLNLQGQRDHQGEATILAEANGMAKLTQFHGVKGTTTGSGPTYTTPFTYNGGTGTGTFDFSTGGVVRRYCGAQISSIKPNMNDNEIQAVLKLSALYSFQARTITSISTTTLVLDTQYDLAPSRGLVVGDLVRVYKAADGTTLDTTIATINADGKTIVLGASAAAFAAGDIIHLRPVTAPTFNLTATFLWAKTFFGTGATASAALANATFANQVRVEPGSTFEIMHKFKNDDGEKRSGGFDPAALLRTTSSYSLAIEKFFDTPEEIQRFNDNTKRAWVISMLAGPTNQYEWRITFNNTTTDTPTGNLSTGDIIMAQLNYLPAYDQGDGQGMSVQFTHSIPTL